MRLIVALLVATSSTALAQGYPQARRPNAQFLSLGPDPWEVMIDRRAACVTPCSIDVPAGYWVQMRSVEERPVLVDVGMMDGAPVTVQVKPLDQGPYVTGIVFTTLGGMALATGITLTAVGCTSDDRRGMCIAGLITSGAGGVVTIGSILLMMKSLPKVHITRQTALIVGPTGAAVAGVF